MRGWRFWPVQDARAQNQSVQNAQASCGQRVSPSDLFLMEETASWPLDRVQPPNRKKVSAEGGPDLLRPPLLLLSSLLLILANFFGNFSSSFAMSRRAGRRRRGTSTCSVGRCRTPGEVPNAPRAPPPHRRPSRPPNISDRGVLTCNDLLGGEGEEAGDTRFLVRCFLWRRCCWVRSKPAEGPARCDRLRSIAASKIQVPKRT
jgi:hypothetical protein